ncbi:MAG TPA: hypothetical protein VEH29_09755 [Acidimicrobiales bacterium]|nr:hypothetical protein [Acidimicrobiales bacterium]
MTDAGWGAAWGVDRGGGQEAGGAGGAVAGPRGHRFLTSIARMVIVATVAIAVGLTVHHGLQIATGARSATSVARGDRANQLEECVYAAIRSELPRGATVYINVNRAYGQLLAELSTLWAVPQATPATAQWVMSVVGGPSCVEVSVEVRRL